jgi:predicted protein tyrosine phosphatase
LSQGHELKVLFLCSRNQWRSPTAERLWRKAPELSVRSAGLSKSAIRRLAARDVDWADVIFVMEDQHKSRLMRDFRNDLNRTPVHVLDIPDDYAFMDPELITLLSEGITPILTEYL